MKRSEKQPSGSVYEAAVVVVTRRKKGRKSVSIDSERKGKLER
jgi:hypothetical protein